MLPEAITNVVTTATARALATCGPHGVNVVPVSVVDVDEGCIFLYNFFMGKTVDNILDQPDVALTCWTGLEGVQIKAAAVYHTSGARFDRAVVTMKERFPDRILSGIIALTPTAVYDVSAGANAGTKLE